MDRKRILIIDNSIDVTGALKSILISSADLSHYYDFVWVVPENSKVIKFIQAEGFTVVYPMKMFELRRSIVSIVFYLPMLLLNSWKLRSVIKSESISAIHVNDVYNLLPVSLHLTGLRIPYVAHIRFLPDRFPKLLFVSWLRLHRFFASQIVCVSESVRKLLPLKINTKVIYNELPIREQYPNARQMDIRTFLYLANYIPGKGQNFALRAFALFNAKVPGWRLRFVGSDMGLVKNREFLHELKKLASELNVENSVDWSGFTDDVEKEYKSGVIALNFSESESFSITCLEAMYYGAPIIATDCGGPAEIIEDQVSGLLVENKNVNQMAQAMVKMATFDQPRMEMAKVAAIKVREKFSRVNTTNKLHAIYQSILN